MAKKCLVACVTKYDAIAGICGKLSQVPRGERSCSRDAAADPVTDIRTYRAVVLGSDSMRRVAGSKQLRAFCRTFVRN